MLVRLIEFDGKQHVIGMDKGVWSHTETLDVIRERDQAKNDFCVTNSIRLVRIPYYKSKTVSYDDLFGDKYIYKGDG